MIRFVLALLATLVALPAGAETLAGAPPKFPIPWGNSAGGAYIRAIPTNSQIGIQNCAASLTDGFPPLTFTPASAGGCPPFGQDMNGILKQLSQWSLWAGGGAGVAYDSSFQTSIGGYPQGATLVDAANAGCFYYSTADNNASNPTTGGANWTHDCTGGGIGTGPSTGTANAQQITTTPFVVGIMSKIRFQAGGLLTNTGATTIQVNGGAAQNVVRRLPTGTTALAGGEIGGAQIVELTWDGANWEVLSPSSDASLTAADQTLSGGANVTTLGLSAGNITIDCGARPLQFIPNTNPFSITAPANDGSCMLQIENGAGAGTVTFSGFTVNGNTGEALDTTNGHKFVVTIWRIHSVSSYLIKALQ